MNDPLSISLTELQDVTSVRASSNLQGGELEQLDEKICLATRKVFVRYVDAASAFDRPDDGATQECLMAAQRAYSSLKSSVDPVDQYAGAHRYANSVGEKAEMLKKIAAGAPVRKVLGEKIDSLLNMAQSESVNQQAWALTAVSR